MKIERLSSMLSTILHNILEVSPWRAGFWEQMVQVVKTSL